MTLRARLLSVLAAFVIRLWTRSLRYQRIGPPVRGPGLVAFWHGDQLALFGVLPGGECVAPVSLSRDGRLQAAILARLGIATVDGSSSRAGERAARGLVRALGRGATALLAVDGPRGPAEEVKPGIVFLARRTGLPIWPVGLAVGAGRRLQRAWDRYLLPRPFTRTIVVVGAPLDVAPGEDLEAARCRLEARLRDLHGEAAAHLLGR